MKAYAAIRNNLATGDIVLFSGKGGISAGIKIGTFSRWSHVGMVVRLPEYDFVTLWESTTLVDLNDLDTRRPIKGVQLVPMSTRLRDYSGDVAVRHLTEEARAAMDIPELMRLRREIAGRPYEQYEIELIRAAYDGPFGRNVEDLSSLFCSELVAEAYQRMALVTETKPSNEYTPADFGEGRGLVLETGALGPEIMLKEHG